LRAHVAVVVAILSTVVLGGCAARGSSAARGRVPSSAKSGGLMVESTDPRLEAAILAEAIRPGAESHLQVAREYLRLGILDAAFKRTDQALQLEPRLAAAHELMARIWRDCGMPGTALSHGHRAVYFAPDSSSAHNTLGTIFNALGRTDEARSEFQRAYALDPAAGWALSNLCYVEFEAGHFAEARRQCEAALRASPALAAARNNLGLTHAGSGDLAAAREAFLVGGDTAVASYNIGIVLLAEGRFAEAGVAFQQAIDARPAYTAAKTRAHEARMRALGIAIPKRP
jgi:tetratricopeptide (TPR) repeat protein